MSDLPLPDTWPDKIKRWRGRVPDDDLAAYAKGAFGGTIGFGARAALLNIDTTHMFVDPAYAMTRAVDPPFLEALAEITTAFRTFGLPIYYSRRDDRSHPTYRGIWNAKLGQADTFQYSRDVRADQWPDAYAPRPEDRIVLKNKPSCFMQTPLESFLRYDSVDTLIVVGTTTSGCVRAAVTDAFSHNFRVVVVEEAVTDRGRAAHVANLFDMDMKYADVMSRADVLAELRRRAAHAS